MAKVRTVFSFPQIAIRHKQTPLIINEFISQITINSTKYKHKKWHITPMLEFQALCLIRAEYGNNVTRKCNRRQMIPTSKCHSTFAALVTSAQPLILSVSSTRTCRMWNSWKEEITTKILCYKAVVVDKITTLIARFMGSTWSPPGSCRPQVGPM